MGGTGNEIPWFREAEDHAPDRAIQSAGSTDTGYARYPADDVLPVVCPPAGGRVRGRPIKYPGPGDAEFAGVRADLALLYMRHRVELGLALASDEWIIEHTNDLTATLWFLSRHAMDHGDEAW